MLLKQKHIKYKIGDLVKYQPLFKEEPSVGIITSSDQHHVQIFWFVKTSPIPERAGKWVAAGLLERAGALKVLSRAS